MKMKMNAQDLKRSAEYLIEQIRDEGAGDDDSVENALHDGELLAALLELDEYDPDDADSVAQHAEAQEIAEVAYSIIKASRAKSRLAINKIFGYVLEDLEKLKIR